jgi:hypothetical protein
MMRWLATRSVGAAVAAACLATPGEAEACHFFAEEDGVSRTTVCFTSLHVGLATLVFAPADIYFAGKRQWLTPEWAWTQLTLGGIVTLGGGFTALALAASDDDTAHPAADIGWSLGLVAVGGFYGSVATFSLEQGHEPSPERNPESGIGLPRLLLLPVEGGAMVTAVF